MNKRVWGIIIVVLGLALIAGIVYFIFFYKFSAPEPAALNQPLTNQSPSTGTLTPEAPLQPSAQVEPAPALKKTEVKADDLARMASAFAERFGSFSNQSDYGNIRDLQIFMTAKMKTWSENYITDARARKVDSSIYYGIVTKSVSGEVKQFDADLGRAEILIKTQRRESAGVSGNSATFYQAITIKYLRERELWRVDEVYWQNR